MIVISDTGPLNYLLLLEVVEVLPRLHGTVTIPEAVRQEMLHSGAPEVVRVWASRLPPWVIVRQPQFLLPLPLDPGERAALSLAVEFQADLVLMDERRGRQEARALVLETIGTLGILANAAGAGLLDLADTLAKLQQTGFYVSEALIKKLLAAQASG